MICFHILLFLCMVRKIFFVEKFPREPEIGKACLKINEVTIILWTIPGSPQNYFGERRILCRGFLGGLSKTFLLRDSVGV